MTLLHNPPDLPGQQFQGHWKSIATATLTNMARSWLKSVSQWVLKVNLRAAVGLNPAPQPLAQRQTRLMREPLGD